MEQTVSIPGMHCDGCINLIKDVTLEMPGVQDVTLDLDTKLVVITHDADFDLADWKSAIEDLDEAYTVKSA